MRKERRKEMRKWKKHMSALLCCIMILALGAGNVYAAEVSDVSQNVEAVSYTQLDVYKRQQIILGVKENVQSSCIWNDRKSRWCGKCDHELLPVY